MEFKWKVKSAIKTVSSSWVNGLATKSIKVRPQTSVSFLRCASNTRLLNEYLLIVSDFLCERGYLCNFTSFPSPSVTYVHKALSWCKMEIPLKTLEMGLGCKIKSKQGSSHSLSLCHYIVLRMFASFVSLLSCDFATFVLCMHTVLFPSL